MEVNGQPHLTGGLLSKQQPLLSFGKEAGRFSEEASLSHCREPNLVHSKVN